ncbi:MAG: tetratricopeptide repeat protein [Dolichospermum sp. DET50]|nr:tetratricopeptide repeat protein [Dolichospermum sp. DET66]MBS3032282.1 tetratricopeptide repeat protein [Dolichospermum sp. DET67]MBS3037487.1 tetratricopeptide repeat protein [Dolichospermum sp. DET50]QSX69457.1 MAG: tetratricopeptide repeat protein [Dolichospermum sp. DET69]
MPLKLSDWDHDLPIEEDEEYQAFIRTLQFTEGFGILFVRCSPAGGEQLISKVKEDINDKNIEVIKLDKDVTNLYEIVDKLDHKSQINILFITGLESALYEYEECKKLSGWSSKETHHYSWEGVPPILININQQRERFRDSFNICFIFLLPQFAIKYFIHRAPDFFDWRSGLFDFPLDSATLAEEATRIIQEGTYEKYVNLTNEEANRKILEIIDIIEHEIDNEQKAKLFFELGYLQAVRKNYEEAISSYDKAVEIKPDDHEAWYSRGISLYNLGRYEEAISSYDKAVEFKPDYYEAWDNRGIVLRNLERYKEAVASYDKALEIKPNNYEAWNDRGLALHELGLYIASITSCEQAIAIKPDFAWAWNNRGRSLNNLGRYEEAIYSYNKAVEFKPDYYIAWDNRGILLSRLGRYEEAISSYEKAVEFKPDDHQSWNNRGILLSKLGRYEEAISSYEKAVGFKPDLYQAWYNKACVYALQGNIEKAIKNLKTAINLNPDKYRKMAKTDSDFDAIREDERFQELIK